MEKDTGGPAFPTENEKQTGPDSYRYQGMTLRDYFAAKAMHGFLSSPQFNVDVANFYNLLRATATEAYRVADAMIEARKGGE